MFYRRKIVLALLQLFEGELEKIRLQKLLFLFSQKQVKSEYDFVPYKFGCFSYSANADLAKMAAKGLLIESETTFKRTDFNDYTMTLKEADRKLLFEIKKLYGGMDANALMRHTYINYPYYAIHSVKAKSILSPNEMDRVDAAKPRNEDTVLFTIGYEGISLEEYLNRLVKNNVKVLVDVRRNPISMKYGFSKSQLQRNCSSIGITYMHFPEVGVQSDLRQELTTQADYDKLFTHYCEKDLPNTLPTQQSILNILKEYKRIALTCFEKDICQCHRKHLAEAIKQLPGFDYKLKHI